MEQRESDLLVEAAGDRVVGHQAHVGEPVVGERDVQRGGFLWNPGGDRLLDTISYDYGYGIRTYVSRSHLLERQRDALLTELTAP